MYDFYDGWRARFGLSGVVGGVVIVIAERSAARLDTVTIDYCLNALELI